MANNIDRPNIANDEAKASFVTRIESLDRQLESEKGTYMKRCATLQEEKKAILDEAKAAGLPKASLKAVLKVRTLERKVVKVREELENDDLEIFVSIRQALGDFAGLPLGAAAVATEEGAQDTTTAAIVAAVQADETVGEKADFSDERAKDAEAFADIEKPKADNVTAIDPAAARRNRSKATTRDTSTAKYETPGADVGEVRF